MMQEEDLRRLVLAGDEAAWRALYDGAMAICGRMSSGAYAGMRDLAEEVTQETWLIAVRRMREFDPEQGRFRGWLRGIAANVLHNHFRTHRRSREQPLTDLTEPACDDAARRDEAEMIARALAEMPDRAEAVLRAKYLDLMSVEEIASAWLESPKAIESLLTRARQAFRTAYEKLSGTDIAFKRANAMNDPVEDYLQHPPSLSCDEALQQGLCDRTVSVVLKSRRVGHWPRVAGVAVCIVVVCVAVCDGTVAGAFTAGRPARGSAGAAGGPKPPREEPKPPPAVPQTPKQPRELEWTAFDTQDDAPAAGSPSIFQAGDLYLDKDNDLESAVQQLSAGTRLLQRARTRIQSQRQLARDGPQTRSSQGEVNAPAI